MYTDSIYQDILWCVQKTGVLMESRNATTKSCIDLQPCVFRQTPLVTLRKTAWRLALREMEWFMSGEEKCPEELLNWWNDQLDPIGGYTKGYGSQLRHFGCFGTHIDFDQIQYVLNGLKSNPNSRRLILTTWNAYDMAHITEFNQNKKTPTCCHSIIVQFFVRKNHLFMTSYQRSADLLLGVPHNWIQSWGLLLWFAHHANLQVGFLRWIFGDAHIYQEASHLKAVDEIVKILDLYDNESNTFDLKYKPKDDGLTFKASDFVMEGKIPEAKVLVKPKLL
jgi:thymidylate synthase